MESSPLNLLMNSTAQGCSLIPPFPSLASSLSLLSSSVITLLLCSSLLLSLGEVPVRRGGRSHDLHDGLFRLQGAKEGGER